MPDQPTPARAAAGRRPQPVVILDVVKALIAAAAGAGYLATDDPLVQAASAGAGGLLFAVATMLTRYLVTPLAAPRDADGQPLTPDPPGRHHLNRELTRNGYVGFDDDPAHPRGRRR